MLPPGPRLNADQGPKKKPPFFVDVPTRSPMNSLGLGYSVRGTKPRGFGKSSTSTITVGRGGPIVTGSLFDGPSDVLLLNKPSDKKTPGADSLLGRSGSPALGSGPRSSVKKLVLDKPVEADLFGKSGGAGKITFNPALSQAAREQQALAPLPGRSPTRSPETPNRLTTNSASPGVGNGSPAANSPAKEGSIREGDYWVKPDLQTLVHSGHDKLLAFENLAVGREGYGEVQFLEPVDLTGLPKLSALFGQVVRFDDKEVAVYPDSDDVDKPPPGTGINVRSRIILLRAWATDKATREPIKDEDHPSAVRHLRRLTKMKDTEFESFDIKEGKWTFVVKHF
jgi:nuclear pore complex protein Nup98-Nup96